MQVGDWLTLGGVVATVVGLALTVYSIYRGNQNASAASLIALNEMSRQGWERFLAAKDENKQHQFAELANVLEMACALCLKRVFIGVSRELLTEYLNEVMRVLDDSADAKARLAALIHSETTFKYLRLYVHRNLR